MLTLTCWFHICMMQTHNCWGLWDLGVSKWPHRIIQGSKFQSVWISLSSISNYWICRKDSKNAFIFSIRQIVLKLWIIQGQRKIMILYGTKNFKLLWFSWKLCQIVRLHLEFQKNNSLDYLQCFNHWLSNQIVIGPIGLMHNWPLWPYIMWTWHRR